DGIRDLIVTGVQTCALPISANLDDAALLIRRDEEADARRRLRGREALHRVGDRAYRGHARRALLDEPDGAEVIAADRIHFGGAEIGRASCRERVWIWVGVVS